MSSSREHVGAMRRPTAGSRLPCPRSRTEAILTTTDIRHEPFGFMLMWGDFGFLPWTPALARDSLAARPMLSDSARVDRPASMHPAAGRARGGGGGGHA